MTAPYELRYINTMSKPDLDKLCAHFGSAIISSHSSHGDETAIIYPNDLLAIAQYVKTQLDYHFLVDVTAVDYFNRHPRFEVVYHFRSMQTGARLRLKVQVADVPSSNPEVESVVSLWPSANWMEREVWDLYGIRFKGHPDLRRILMYEEFVGHPLRKDYPKEKRQPLVRRENLLPSV